MKIGYIRVSTEEQTPARQQALLHELDGSCQEFFAL